MSKQSVTLPPERIKTFQAAMMDINDAFEQATGQTPAMMLCDELRQAENQDERQEAFNRSAYSALDALWAAATEQAPDTLAEFEEEFADFLTNEDE